MFISQNVAIVYKVYYPYLCRRKIYIFITNCTIFYREVINKMVEKMEEFDDVQTVYTNMKPEEE